MKIPPTLHPQTDEVSQQRREKDVTAMLMTLYKELIDTQQKLQDTETTLEAALQRREQGQSSKPPTETIDLEEPPKEDIPPKQQPPETEPATTEPATTAPPTEKAE